MLALFAWALLVGLEVLWIPATRVNLPLSWMAILVVWLWAIVQSVKAVMSYLSRKAYGRCVAASVAIAITWAVVWTTNWNALYVESFFALHRDTFAQLAIAHENHRPLVVPWWMRYLSVDGEVQKQGDAIYLPVVLDQWRGESGAGIAYLPVSKTSLQTSAGSVGGPVHDLGDGWWWVE
ncbi:hypothetical protein [Streptosporangium minutum]|uniref:Uncharacterized protein n=1 Tax=Streptosporangium minutum TaxID=569862 RepID=A0A243RMA1_9ACTN|nr:hypothetical protein [Streptosporangium minutum]OUC96054.1 hypothetical protein CA984_16375 [Streptosporangium minutum]